MNMNVDYKALAAQAAAMEDQTEVKEGGDYEYVPPAAGLTIGRLISYVELGRQPQRPYQGQAKQPCDEVRLVFELLHPKKNIKDVEIDGKPTKVSDIISIRMAKKLGEKAKFKRVFDMMRYGRADIKHMAQMLNDPFLLTVFHNTSEKDGKKTVYANLNDANGTYHISAPRVTDPLTQESKAVPVPESLRGLQMFLWDNPNKAMWDGLFIDGTREIKVGDKVEHKSNNWLQELILSAVNYKGSNLEAMLGGLDDLPAGLNDDEGSIIGEPLEVAQVASGTLPAATLAAAAPKVTNAADDALAAMGLG